jgi:hypothetical protein
MSEVQPSFEVHSKRSAGGGLSGRFHPDQFPESRIATGENPKPSGFH